MSTAAQLTSALAGATPGDTITLADGTYHGNFTAKVPATEANPIRLTGSRSAILDGGNVSTGYALHLDGADYWQVDGFSVGDAQKAIVLDATSHATLSNLNIHHTGDELVLLRNYSRNDLVTGNEIYDSGLVTPGYGEGVYVGLAISNWSSAGQSRTGGQPDTSDGVTISGNDIHDTTAENIDIKEGTSGGTISGNTFNAHGLSGANYADSWVDIAGNGYTVSGNTGTNPGGALLDGYQTHVQASGWGRLNVFSANTSAVNASGYGFDIQNEHCDCAASSYPRDRTLNSRQPAHAAPCAGSIRSGTTGMTTAVLRRRQRTMPIPAVTWSKSAAEIQARSWATVTRGVRHGANGAVDSVVQAAPRP